MAARALLADARCGGLTRSGRPQAARSHRPAPATVRDGAVTRLASWAVRGRVCCSGACWTARRNGKAVTGVETPAAPHLTRLHRGAQRGWPTRRDHQQPNARPTPGRAFARSGILNLRHPGIGPGACDPDARGGVSPGGATPVPHTERPADPMDQRAEGASPGAPRGTSHATPPASRTEDHDQRSPAPTSRGGAYCCAPTPVQRPRAPWWSG